MRKELAYFLDYKRFDNETIARLLQHLSEKFQINPADLVHQISRGGIPVLAKEVWVAVPTWAAAGNDLRAAVGWRVFQGKAALMAQVTGVQETDIHRFVSTGEISDDNRRRLDAAR